MHAGVIASHNNAPRMFKVTYFNGDAEEMGPEDLMMCLMPHKEPVQAYPPVLPRNDENGEDMAQPALAQPLTQQIGSTEKIPGGALDDHLPVSDDVPPQVGGDAPPPPKEKDAQADSAVHP